MQTAFDSLYSIRIFFLKENPLPYYEFWQQIMAMLEPLIKQAAQPSRLYPSVYDDLKKDYLEFDKLQWNKEDLRKWTVPDDGKRNLRLENIEAFFPSPQTFRSIKTTPDIVIKAYSKAVEDEHRYESIFALLVKQEFLKTIPEEEKKQVLKKLREYLSPTFTAIATKPWAVRKSELRYGESLQHFFPSEILAGDTGFVLTEGFEKEA